MVSKELRNVLLNNSERMKVGSRPRRVILSHCSRFVGGAEASRPPGGLRAASGRGPPGRVLPAICVMGHRGLPVALWALGFVFP